MISDACVEELSVSNILIGPEKGRQVVFRNDNNLAYLRIRVDGCVYTDQGSIRADWALDRSRASVIVELKGKDVEHAADQILATAHRWKIVEQRCSKVAGLVIGQQRPAASTTIQKKKQEFAKRFGGPLHVVNKNPVVVFDHVLSFKGPFKGDG